MKRHMRNADSASQRAVLARCSRLKLEKGEQNFPLSADPLLAQPTSEARRICGPAANMSYGMAGGPPPELDDAEEEGEWNDDYTPSEGRYGTKWPEDWSKEKIAEEAADCVKHYVEDWGWELHKYARLKKEDRVRKVLRYEIHLEACDGYGKQKQVLNWQDEDFGQCALWWLAMHGLQDLVQLLIDAGCDVNIADKDGWTPLSVAAFYGHAEVIKALLAAGADASREVDDGDTAYDKAVAWDHPDCAALLKGEARAHASRALPHAHAWPNLGV